MKKLPLIGLFTLFSVLEICAQQISSYLLSNVGTVYSGCSIITVSKGNHVFFGGNDDYINSDSYYWVEPGDSTKYGVVWVGTPDNPQQGINEKGLAYDANGLPRFELKTHSDRIPVPGGYQMYCMGIMHDCATVQEVIDWVQKHQHYPYMQDQLHFADASGDAVILSAGENGEIVFTRKAPGDGFLVSTNFNVANHANNYSFPCWRYDKANELLGAMIETNDPLSFRNVTAVMDAVHLEKGSSWTISTLVADLVTGDFRIYYFFQYDRPVVLNVKKELANPRDPGPLSKLFPEDVQEEAAKRFHAAQDGIRTNKLVGIGWPIILLISLILLFLNRGLFSKGFRFWIIAVIFLGPVALITGFLALKKCRTSFCRNAFIETLGSDVPIVVSYTVALTILIINTLSGNVSWQVQVMLMFGLPLITGLVVHTVFHATNGGNPGRSLAQCIPLVLITTFLGLGGIIPVALPLVNKSLTVSLLMPLSPLPLMTWWALVVLGALPGGILIFVFQHWAVKNGLWFWSVLTAGEKEFFIPKWKNLWWWILISICILFAGLLISVVLLKQ